MPRAEALKVSRMFELDYSDENDSHTKQKKNKKSRKSVTNVGADKITYPSSVTIFKSTTNFSRVVQPNNMTLLSKERKLNFGFQIKANVLHGLEITKTGGIIYIQDPEALVKMPTGTYLATVTWSNYSTVLEIVLKNGNSSCHEDTYRSICANFHSKKSCLSYCGTGTMFGNCEWRQSATETKNLEKNYSTCSPSLETCPDGYCDPLESMAKKNGYSICPQDCSTNIFIGRMQESGHGIYSGVGVCACDEMDKCSCMPESEWRLAGEKEEEAKHPTAVPISSNKEKMILEPRQAQSIRQTWVVAVICVILVVLLIALSSCLVRRQDKRTFKKRMIKEHELLTEKLKNETRIVNIEVPLLSPDEKVKFNIDAKWEMKRENIELQETIGEGEFGKVVRGYATNLPGTIEGATITVAIKMLKTGVNHFELLALMSEYQMLQDLSHPNVIKLLGACTSAETPLLIIEYCHFGSLKNYLRLSRNVSSSVESNYENQVEPVTEHDVLSFAWQISKGMAYLADMKLVHRDLAARNVLLAEGKVCKISDFGLTRDIYEDDAYLKKSKDRVPVKVSY